MKNVLCGVVAVAAFLVSLTAYAQGSKVPRTAPQPDPIATSIVTDVQVENLSAAALVNAPITFGQVFAKGDVKAGESLNGKLIDGTTLPLQLDVKALHPDGSVRHALVSMIVPKFAAGQALAVRLAKTSAAASTPSPSPSDLLRAGFSGGVELTLNGARYTASADALLRSGNYKTWLAGPIVNEWIVSAPLKSSGGIDHPHLTARFAVRSYTGLNKARVDVTIENDWAYEAAPQNFTYAARILIGGKSVYEKSALTHFHHARWRKLFWWGQEPQVYVRHNSRYLIATRAVPNYDQSIMISAATLAGLRAGWTGPATEPMGVGLAQPYMPTTGGRKEIGLLPSWAAMYLLSMDKRAKEVMLGTADLAGSWSSHYRNKATDRPVSLKEYPYMTILGHPGDTLNPATGKQEFFPPCATTTGCVTPNTHDTAHQAAFAYLPYLVTGDYYYLEELQFWSMWNTFADNPGYRDAGKGLLKPDQVRGQAWSLRTLAEAAYITPDADPLKSHFEYFLSMNLDWYNANYTNNPDANKLGAIVNGYALVYDNETALAPWMDDFFTSAVAHAAELGNAKAASLLRWKAKFPVSRMVGQGSCWIDGAKYSIKVRDSASSPFYATMAQAYAASHTPALLGLPCGGTAMAAALGLKVGEMTGYSSSETGYPSNMQPALAHAVDAGLSDAAAAWRVFAARTVKPDYALGPQFAIIPR